MPHRPRAARDFERARATSSSAMDRVLAQIGAAFGEAAAVNDFKLRVERLVRLGPQHPAVQARFGSRAEMLYGRNLAAAIAIVERWWRNERRAFQIASAFGYGNRLSLEVLRELRLVLRLMRLKRMYVQFATLSAALRGDILDAPSEAAE